MVRQTIRNAMFVRLLAVLITLIICAAPIASWAYPLRIWVMHNEIGSHEEPVTERRIREAIRRWRDEEHILIENSVRNLLMPREMNEAQPFADYIVGDNQFLKELAKFKQSEEDDRPIAVEFIRWNDAYNKLTGALSSSDMPTVPDIVQIGSTWTASLADRNLLADISEHFPAEQFVPSSIASTRMFGKDGMFAVPWFVDTRLLFYRKEDISSPDQLADWDAFFTTCESFKKTNNRHLIGFQHTISWDLLHNLSPWLWAAGGGIIEPVRLGPINTYRVLLDDHASLDGMRYLKKLAMANCASFASINQESSENKFLRGEYATVISGPWLINRMGKDWPEHYGIALPPAGPAGSVPFVGGSHLAISQASYKRGNFPRAVALIKHMTSAPAQVRFAVRNGLPPANREALDGYLSGSGKEVFRLALERGRSYPSIPDWGTVVENEMIRTHIWHIWRDIAYGASDETQIHTVHQAAGDLRKKIMLSTATRYALHGGLLLCGIAALGLGGLAWWRRRYVRACRTIERKTNELASLAAERTILEGRILLLTRQSNRQTSRLAELNKGMALLKERAARLTSELAAATAQHQERETKRIGPFAIESDGALIIDNEEVRFENNRQARRLIEHMTRMACRGARTAHCLWGYVLFDWDPKTLQSSPQRLFETMVSKINGRLKKIGRPALMGRVGKKMPAWKYVWEIGSICTSSNVYKAIEVLETARTRKVNGNADGGGEIALVANRLDPKNLDALAILRAGDHNHEAILAISRKLLQDDLDSLERGIKSIEDMLERDRLPRGIERDEAGSELRLMRCEREYLATRMEEVFADTTRKALPSAIGKIASCMMAVKSEIAALRNNGVSGQHLWASVVDSNNFLRLVSVPQIQSLVNNFYNRDTQEREDPRLIQLAMVSMLSTSSRLDITHVHSEEEAFTVIRRGIFKELCALENQLSCP